MRFVRREKADIGKRILIEEIDSSQAIDVFKMTEALERLETGLDNFDKNNENSLLNKESNSFQPLLIQPPSMETLLVRSTPRFPISPASKPSTSKNESKPGFKIDINEGEELDMLKLLGLDNSKNQAASAQQKDDESDDSDIEVVSEVAHEEAKGPKKCLVFAQVPEVYCVKPSCILVYPPGSMEAFIQNKPLSGNSLPEKPFIACRSRKYQEHKYLFEWDKIIRRKNIEGETFSCLGCRQFKKNFKQVALNGSTPFIAGNSKKWVLCTDPDFPVFDHFCIIEEWKEKLENIRKKHGAKKKSVNINDGLIKIPADFDSRITYGKVTSDPASDKDGLLVFFPSRLYNGFRYEFEVDPASYVVIEDVYHILTCHGCKELKKATEYANKVVPQIFIRGSEVVYSNPDEPYNGQHFCIPDELRDDPNVRRRLRRSAAAQQAKKNSKEDDKFKEEEKEILDIIKFLEEQQSQIDNKIIIAGSKLKKLNMENLHDEASLERLLTLEKVISLKSMIMPQMEYRFEMVGDGLQKKSKVVGYRCAKCYAIIQHRKNFQKFLNKIPVIFYDNGKLVTKNVDCPDGHPHWCTNRNPEQLLASIGESVLGIAKPTDDPISKAIAARTSIINSNNLFSLKMPHTGLHQSANNYIPGKPNLSFKPNSSQIAILRRPQASLFSKSLQNSQTTGNGGASLEMEDDFNEWDKAKQKYFSIEPRLSSLPTSMMMSHTEFFKQQRGQSESLMMEDAFEKPTTSKKRKAVEVSSDESSVEMIDSEDEEWDSSQDGKNPFNKKAGNMKKNKVGSIQPIGPFSKIIQHQDKTPRQQQTFSNYMCERFLTNSPTINLNRFSSFRMRPNTSKLIAVTPQVTPAQSLGSMLNRFPTNPPLNMHLSTVPQLNTQFSGSNLPQKRPTPSISPNFCLIPKRPTPSSSPGFDLSALLNSKPVSVEVKVGLCGEEVEGTTKLPFSEKILVLKEEEDVKPQLPMFIQKVSKPLNRNITPVTQTTVVPQVSEGLNLKQLLDIELHKK